MVAVEAFDMGAHINKARCRRAASTEYLLQGLTRAQLPAVNEKRVLAPELSHQLHRQGAEHRILVNPEEEILRHRNC